MHARHTCRSGCGGTYVNADFLGHVREVSNGKVAYPSALMVPRRVALRSCARRGTACRGRNLRQRLGSHCRRHPQRQDLRRLGSRLPRLETNCQSRTHHADHPVRPGPTARVEITLKVTRTEPKRKDDNADGVWPCRYLQRQNPRQYWRTALAVTYGGRNLRRPWQRKATTEPAANANW